MLEKITIHNMIALDRCMDGVDTAMKALNVQHKINKRTKTLFLLSFAYMVINQLTIIAQDQQIRDLTKEVKELKEMKGE